MNILQKYTLIGAFGGAVLGSSVTYLVLKNRFDTQYDIRLEQEMQKSEAYWRSREADIRDSQSHPTEILAERYPGEIKKVMETYSPSGAVMSGEESSTWEGVTPDGEPIRVLSEDETQVNNVFVNGDPLLEDDWDYEEELKKRDTNFPYVIHRDEFEEGFPGHGQATLSYYEDNILVDEGGQIVDDVEGMVGIGNLDFFGKGSDDIHIVYIRNENLGMDYEVTEEEMSYAEGVHGFIQHSDHRHLRRFRGDDE